MSATETRRAQRNGSLLAKMRATAFTESNRACSVCSVPAECLHIHHKDRNSLNNSPGNWQVLCPQCHRSVHKEEREHAVRHRVTVMLDTETMCCLEEYIATEFGKNRRVVSAVVGAAVRDYLKKQGVREKVA